MKTHKVKSWQPFFQAIKAGQKTHDLRYDGDRSFEVGDQVVLQEYLPFEGRYTGEECTVEVTYITSSRTPCAFSSAVLDKEYCILSLKLVSSSNGNGFSTKYGTAEKIINQGGEIMKTLSSDEIIRQLGERGGVR